MRRVHYGADVKIEPGQSVTFKPSGDFAQVQREVFAPDQPAIQRMLAEFRDGMDVPTGGLAAILGVPTITARRWLDGSRKPSGAAKRLIWFLHTAHFRPDLLSAPGAWLIWARAPADDHESNSA